MIDLPKTCIEVYFIVNDGLRMYKFESILIHFDGMPFYTRYCLN